MDATRGIHALATFIFCIFLTYWSWYWVTGFIENRTDPIINSILWISYIIMIIVGILATPALIALSEDSDATIVSYVKGLGIYCIGLIYVVAFELIMGIFVGSQLVTSILTNSFHVQIMTLLFMIGLIIFLFLAPITMALTPNLYEA